MENTLSATYSPEDNKLRLYALHRLDSETYERVKAEGFRWAPKQDLFVAPAWTPAREDLLIDLCGEIGDEDTTLAERADVRAYRFDGYRERRGEEAENARQAVNELADAIPLGQPILVGHHSQRRAERDKEKIDRGMRRAVNLWKTSQYWNRRAAGVLRHADYKHRPGVIERRIKKLEAERRKWGRDLEKCQVRLDAWTADGLTHERAEYIANVSFGSYCFTLEEYPRDEPASQYEGAMSLWSALDGGVITAEQARDLAVPSLERAIPHFKRWAEHLTLRIGYERALSGIDTPAEGDTPRVKSTRPKLPPIVNHPGEDCRHISKAEWTKKHRDYKSTRKSEDGTYRYRVMMFHNDGQRWGATLVPVFITDQKVVEPPQPELIAC